MLNESGIIKKVNGTFMTQRLKMKKVWKTRLFH